MEFPGNRHPRPGPPPEDFWLALFWEQLLHPQKLEIIEILRVVDLPLSASILHEISEGELAVSAASYHLRTLSERFGVLEVVGQRRARGATEIFFHWASGPS